MSDIELKVLRRFIQKIEPQKECWLWRGATSPQGYGYCYSGTKVGRASRYMYALIYGDIPQGLTIDHLCFNKGCVNPWHLEAVSIGENVRRGNSIERGRTKLLVQSQKKIEVPIKSFLEAQRASGKTYVELARELGISSPTVAYWCKKLGVPKGQRSKESRLVLRLAYWANYEKAIVLRENHEDWTLQQIGTELGISRERVRQILKKAGLNSRRILWN